jgi:hypothetical protein
VEITPVCFAISNEKKLEVYGGTGLNNPELYKLITPTGGLMSWVRVMVANSLLLPCIIVVIIIIVVVMHCC